MLVITESEKNINHAESTYIIGDFKYTSNALFKPSINYSICIEPVAKALTEGHSTCYLLLTLDPNLDFEVEYAAKVGSYNMTKILVFIRPSSLGLHVGAATVSVLFLVAIAVLGYFIVVKKVGLPSPTAEPGKKTRFQN